MTATKLRQDCTSSRDSSGVERFQISTAIEYVNPGDLPFAEIFVYLITNSADPKADVFERVASVTDLTLLPQGREGALRASAVEYLSNSFTVNFADVMTATAAKGLIRDRIDALILSWTTSQQAFFTPSEYISPNPATSLTAAAIAAYTVAKQYQVNVTGPALVTAEGNLVAAQAAATAANTALTTAVALDKECAAETALIVAIASAESTFRGAAGAFVTASNTFIAACAPSSPLTVFEAQLVLFVAAITAELANGSSAINSLSSAQGITCSAKHTAAATTTPLAKVAADNTAAAAQTAYIAAQAADTAASAAEHAALATVLQYCPTFDPTSV